MPLPAGNTPWPPRELDPVTARLAVWSTWYSGDPDRLSEMYGGSLAGDPGQPVLGGFLDPNRPGWRGRLGATMARFFWGVQTPSNERRTKIHLPLAGDIASTSADLLFSEPPTISVTSKTVTDSSGSTKSESSATQDRLNELIDDGMHADLLEAAEVCAGLGGVYLRVCWDKEVRDRPWLSAIHADAAIPEWRWGILRAVTCWKVVATEGNIVRRHLERHEPGVILHGLYEGSAGDLGKPIPLDADPATTGLQEKVATLVPDRLTVTYIPNMRPARVWRDTPAGAHLGRADFAGTEGFMDAADEAWSSLMRDLRLGKGRLLVPDVYLNSDGKGQGASWESEREIYTGLSALPAPGSSGMAIMPTQFQIRVTEHLDTVRGLVDTVVRSSGYSESDFGEAGTSERTAAMTATEVDSKRTRSNITRDRKITYWRPGLAEITETLLAVDAAHFASGVEPEKPEVEFGDGVSVEPETLATTAQLLRAAEAASTRTLVEMVHPDWEDDQIDAEVEAIKGEAAEALSVSDPGSDAGMGREPGSGASSDGEGAPAKPAGGVGARQQDASYRTVR